ncbi:MAG: hypothetical protein SEPTF4163_002535 [Sporothrix epigloea]
MSYDGRARQRRAAVRSASAATPSPHVYERPRVRHSSQTTDGSFDDKSALPGFITKLFPSKKPERGASVLSFGVGPHTNYPYKLHDSKHANPRLRRKGAESDLCQHESVSRGRSVYHDRPLPPPPDKTPGAWPSVTESQSTIHIEPGPLAPASYDTFYEDKLAPNLPFQRKLEIHLERKSLKESGDFLGVQGVNPETGQLDVLTPTTGSKSTLSSGTSAVASGSVQSSMERYERNKDKLRRQQSLIRWRRETGQWSSAAAPGLSPIEQSRDTTPTHPLTPPKTWTSQASTAVWNSVRMSSAGWGTASAASTATHLPPPVPLKIMHSAHSRPEDAKTDDITKHQVKSIAPRERDTFLPQPSLSSPDPRSDMHWGLASTKLADDHESESGDVLQAALRRVHAASTPPASTRKTTVKHETSRIISTGSTFLKWTTKAAGKHTNKNLKNGQLSISRETDDQLSNASTRGDSRRDPRNIGSSGNRDGDVGYIERSEASVTGEAGGRQQSRVCMHTHHHHYWIRHPSPADGDEHRQKLSPHDNGHRRQIGQRSSGTVGNEARVQAAGPQHEALYEGFPTERETEQMAEHNRPRSRNSHTRYYIVETPHGD